MRYPKGFGLNKAKANMCQGSSADCAKEKTIEIYNYFKHEEPECRIILLVHDEYNISIPRNAPNKDEIIDRIKVILETFNGVTCPIKLRIPIRTDFGIGENWAAASGKGI